MTSEHVSDDYLQTFALDQSECPAAVVDHILTCPLCQRTAAVYARMMEGLALQPLPTPEFDLYVLAMSGIAAPPARPRKEYFPTVITVVAACVASIFLFIFRQYFLAILRETPPSALPFVILACLSLPFLRAIEIYGNHRRMIALVSDKK